MGAHWRLAARYTVFTIAFALLAGAVVWIYYGEAHAGALLYGVAVGLVSFISTALSVSLITARSELLRVLGATSFFLRYGFVAGALGLPAYLGAWPAVAMMGGFAGVYLAENVVLLPGAVRVMSKPSSPDKSGLEVQDEKAERERRVTV